MHSAKVVRIGAEQFVLLPKGFSIDADEFEILRRGEEIILRPKPANLARAFKLMAALPAFEREDEPPQERGELGPVP